MVSCFLQFNYSTVYQSMGSRLKENLLDSTEAAKLLGISVDQVRRRVKEKILEPVYKSRNTLLFSREELERDHPAEPSG